METKNLIEHAGRIWDTQAEHGAARARLKDSCGEMAKAVTSFGQALGDVLSTARTLGGFFVEVPTAHLSPDALRDRALALRELDTWIAAARQAIERMHPAYLVIADVAATLHNAEHGKAPE